MARAGTKLTNSAPQLSEFKWQGINRRGRKVQGIARGDTVKQVRAQLREQGIAPGKIVKKTQPFWRRQTITSQDMAVMTRQLATMLAAGVPLLQSLDMIARGTDNLKMRQLVLAVANEVSSGSPLADSLRKHPLYFDDLYCDLVHAGEQSGSLETIYDRIATYREKAEALKAKIKKAMVYPIAVIVVAIGVTAILLLFVVPQFKAIFDDFGAELPAFTQLVIAISEGLQHYFLHFVAAAVGAGFLFRYQHRKSRRLRDRVDRLVLKIPVVGSILHKAAVARYARTLSTTFAAGVPLMDALESAAGAAGNAVYRDAILQIREEVSSGMQMNTAMQNVNLFPEMVTQMVRIGEEAGAVDDMLAKVASIYERQVDDLVDGLTALLEPIIMVVIGVLVGGLIISMYLPIFQLGNVVR